MLRRSQIVSLPPSGAVGGIDVGWSRKRASSAVARLEWDARSVRITVRRFRAIAIERAETIGHVLDRPMLAVSLDGPLCTGLVPATTYRHAERLLTSGFQPLIGKPGQASSPNGRLLNESAVECAKVVIAGALVGDSTHPERIHNLAIVESFPTTFLGVLLPDPAGLKARRRSSSDVFYEALSLSGALSRLLERLLPGRAASFDFADFRNHDDRAAIVCAVTSLCVAAGDYTAVGDNDGWIVLPPYDLVADWAHRIMKTNVEKARGAGNLPKTGVKLGLAAFMYPSMSLEGFNASDAEIASMFYGENRESEASA